MGKDEWRPALEDWLSSKELALTSHSYPPLGFAIAVGWRDDNVLHAVIVKDGDFYHDPNPSGQFVRNIRNYWTVSKVPGAADVA